MADYDFEDRDTSDIVGSYTSYKGKNTTAIRKPELLLDLQSKNYPAVTATSINDQIAKTERIVDILAALAAWPKENNYKKADYFVKEADNFVERVRVCADLLSSYIMLIPSATKDRDRTQLHLMLLWREQEP